MSMPSLVGAQISAVSGTNARPPRCRDLKEVWRRAADLCEIPATWLVHAGCRRAATGGASCRRTVAA